MPLKSTITVLCLGALLFDAPAAMKRADLMPEGELQLHVTGAKQLKDDFNAAFGERLFSDERFQNFTAALAEKIRKKSENGEAPLALLQTLEILKLLEGEILHIGSLFGGDDDRFYFTAAATKEVYATVLERTDWLRRQHEDHFTRKREEFQNTTLTHDILNGGTTNETHVWMGHIGSTLLMSEDRTWVEKSVVGLRNNELRDEPTESDLRLTLPVGSWTRDSLKKLEAEKATVRKNLLQALGLWDLGTYEIGLSFNPNGDMVVDGVLSAENLENGLFALLDLEPATRADPRTIATDATSFSYGKLNLKRYWRNLPSLLQGMPLKKAMATSGLIAMFQQQSELNIEHDLMEHLGNRYSLSSAMVGTNQTLVLAWELTDGVALEQSIARLLASPLAAQWVGLIETDEYRGHTVRSLKNKKNPGTGPALCLTPDWLILAMRSDLARDLLQRLDRAEAPAPGPLETQAHAQAPENAFGYGGMNHQKTSGYLNVSISDSTFHMGLGLSNKSSADELEKELAENEISLNYLMKFIGNTSHFAEAVPGGVHHRLILENVKPKGATP